MKLDLKSIRLAYFIKLASYEGPSSHKKRQILLFQDLLVVMSTKLKRERKREEEKKHQKSCCFKEMANLSYSEFKTLVISMPTELTELGRKMKKEMKATQSEIKQNIQGTKSEGKETRTQINDLEQKEEINIQQEQNDETRIPKNEERLRNLQDIFKCSNIRS